MANVKPFDIIAGPADVFIAAVGTAFPLQSAAESSFGSAWINLGQTEGGVTVTHTQTVVPLMTDQVTAPVKAVRSEEHLQITFGLAELTLANYAAALNQALQGPNVSGTDQSVYIYRGFQVETVAMLIRGNNLSAYGNFNLQYEAPAVYQSGSPAVQYIKSNKAVLACSFDAIADPNAAVNAVSVFGVLRMGTV